MPGEPTDTTETLPTDEEPNAGSMKPVAKEPARMPGADKPTPDKAGDEGPTGDEIERGDGEGI